MGRSLLLALLLGWPCAVYAAPPADFAPRCTAVMQRALPKRPRAELEAFCSCTETRARADGATGAVLLGYAEALERDAKAPAPPAIRAAARACFEQEIQRVNDELREDSRRRAEARNRGRAQLAYRWIGWRHTKQGLEEFELTQDAWPIQIGGVDCRLQEVRTRERRDRQLWMRDVMRTLDCPGADVTITGTEIAPDQTGCSHSRDGAIGIEGRARFEVRPRSGNAPGGMLSLACERINR